MNARPKDSAEAEPGLSRLLPTPGAPDISGVRQQRLEDYLMQEITRPPSPVAAPARGRRRRWALTAVPLAAAVAVIVTVSTSGGNSAPKTTAISPTVEIPRTSAHGTTTLLDRVAAAALAEPASTVNRGQFEYIKSVVGFSRPLRQRTMDGPTKLDAVHEREVWLPAVPSTPGLIREGGKDMSLGGADTNVRIDGARALPTGADNTIYAQLALLPTDPDALLKKIYSDTKGQAPSPDAAAFNWVGDTVGEAIVPPKLNAAIWRATADIPGVMVVGDAVDAAGRHGQAIAHESNGERTEYIFDKQTFNYLGERSYLVRNTSAGKAGQLTGTSAVLSRALVDKLGQQPSGSHTA